MVNVYATDATSHCSFRAYIDRDNEPVTNFLKSVCIWGDFDHEINGYIGFEITDELFESVIDILEKRFDCMKDDSILT